MLRSLGGKIAASFTLIIILMASIAINGMNSFNGAVAEYMHIIGVQDKLIMNAMALENDVYQQQVRVNRYLSTKDESFKREFNDNKPQLDRDIVSINVLLADIPADVRQEYIDIEKSVEDALRGFYTYIDDVFRMQDQGSEGTALAKYIKNVGNPTVSKLNTSIDDLITHTEDRQKVRLESADKARRTSSLIQKLFLAISTIVSAIIAFLLTRSVVIPVKAMTEAARLLAAGDLTKELTTQKRDDEVGVLAQSFSSMSVSLKNIIKEVGKTAEYLASSSEELTASADQASAATSQVAQTIEQISIGAQQEVDTVHQTNASVQDMFVLVESANAAIDELASEAEVSIAKAANGESVVIDVIKGMSDLNTIIDNAEVMITGLAERSSEIGKVVELISEIAEQTNLLALNAAIESARAGEYGRGFAVVAEEVRRLSERSQVNAKGIKQLVESINKDITGTVKTISDGNSSVRSMVAVADGAGTALQEIGTSIRSMKRAMEKMQEVNSRVKSGASNVVAAMENISAITEETSASSEEVSASAEEQNAVLGEVAANARSLSDTAQTLASMVAGFKW